MVIGELVHKNFALAVPLATAKLVIPFHGLFTTIFKHVAQRDVAGLHRQRDSCLPALRPTPHPPPARW
jgi:hypothetical protein